jgi:hypothetical protein
MHFSEVENFLFLLLASSTSMIFPCPMSTLNLTIIFPLIIQIQISNRDRMKSFLENFHEPFFATVFPVDNVVENCQRDTNDCVLQVGLRNCGIIQVDCRTAVWLFQRHWCMYVVQVQHVKWTAAIFYYNFGIFIVREFYEIAYIAFHYDCVLQKLAWL